MPGDFLSAVIVLALVVDPFGNITVVNAMLARVDPGRRRLVVVRECAIAFVTLAAFMFFGREILRVMGLSETSLSIAGGVILFMIAIRMVFGNPEGVFGLPGEGEPFIVPLAIPLIAGPSALATVMLLASREPRAVGLLAGALTVVMLFTTGVLVAGEAILRRIGERAMLAIERLMGLILTAIAVEMLLRGIRAFVGGLQ